MSSINVNYEKIWSRFKQYIGELSDKEDDVRPQDILTVMDGIDNDVMLLRALYLAGLDFAHLEYVANYERISRLLNEYDKGVLVPLLEQNLKKYKDQNEKRSTLLHNLAEIISILEAQIYEE